MAGAPETIVLDRGSHYITDDAYEILASLGITNLGAPAGKPWLKPFIERLFRTLHSDFLLRFSGRAFSNVVERADNDPAQRATLTLEAFLTWLVRWTVDAYHNKPHAGLGMSPKQAWDRATREAAPHSLTSAEMREVFGVRLQRKLSRKGLLVSSVDYQSEHLMSHFLTSNDLQFEVLRWHGDIGTISARCDDGPWHIIPASEERWIGKTEADLQEWLSESAVQDPDEARARRDFINDANANSHGRKILANLISGPKTLEEQAKDVERAMRHADTAQRRHAAGPYRGIYDDMGSDASSLNPPAPTTEPTEPVDGGDPNETHTME
jgi:hypothetical protein